MVQVSCHRFGNCERFVDQVFQWLHLRHSGQRALIHVNFTELQFGLLTTIAGLATLDSVDASWLSTENNNFLALACLACLSSLLWLSCSGRKSPLRHKFIAFLVRHDVSQTPCGPPTLSFSQDRVAQLQHSHDVLESGHGILQWQAKCGDAWSSATLRCLVGLAVQNFVRFHVANMSIAALAEPPAHISTQMVA